MSFCLWLTGLPGSGKSTIVNKLSRMLTEAGIETVTLSLEKHHARANRFRGIFTKRL